VDLQSILTGSLLLLGLGFLVANARLLLDYSRFLKRRRAALLTWPGEQPPYHGLTLAIGAVLGVLILAKLTLLHRQAFGEVMMFIYYAYLLPLSRRIGRGFYEDGIWADGPFIRYQDVGGISWREEERRVTLVVISRSRGLARRLVVPGDKYGAARRLLRDKISAHAIQLMGTGLDLGGHTERDTV
jgi:hypothetical protein